MSQTVDRQSELASDSPDDPGPRRRDAERAESASSRALYQFGRFGLILALLVVIVTFSLWVPDTFFVWGNFRGTLDQQAIIMMVALGAMLPLIVGEFDLSVGANAGLAALLCVGLAQNQQVTPWLAIVLAVLVATVVGLINGLVVTRLRMSSFVATLGTATILVGVGQAYTGGTDINAAPESLVSIGRATILGLPAPVVVVLLTAVVLLLILQKLPTGRQLLAVGANRRAAELTGIRPDRRIVLAFASGGAIAGLGGALYGAQLGTGTQSLGATLLLPAFAGAFLGATTITPGRFNVIGTIVAVLLLAFTVSGLQQVGVQPWIQFVVQGGALLVAVALSSWAADLRLARLRDAQLEHLVPVEEQPREAQSG
jgi:ribose transport system permease protein